MPISGSPARPQALSRRQCQPHESRSQMHSTSTVSSINCSGGVEAPPSQGFARMSRSIFLCGLRTMWSSSAARSVWWVSQPSGAWNGSQIRSSGQSQFSGGDIILNGTRPCSPAAPSNSSIPRSQPVVNLSVTTAIKQYNISLRFLGPVDQSHTIHFRSVATIGGHHPFACLRRNDRSQRASATPANQTAETLVANQVSSQVTRQNLERWQAFRNSPSIRCSPTATRRVRREPTLLCNSASRAICSSRSPATSQARRVRPFRDNIKSRRVSPSALRATRTEASP